MGLKELREKRGMTQDDLAEKSGVARTRICDFERGARSVGRAELDTAIRLADALKVRDLRKLIDGSTD